MELTDHLFRHEAGRMVAVLTHLFGVHNLALAEDVVQDASAGRSRSGHFGECPNTLRPGSWRLPRIARWRSCDANERFEHLNPN